MPAGPEVLPESVNAAGHTVIPGHGVFPPGAEGLSDFGADAEVVMMER